MARQRSSDTAAIVARPPHRQRSDESEHHSISVRPIDNGYLIERCTQKGGTYKTTCEYSADRPVIEADRPGTGPGDESLAKAVDVAKGN